RSRGGLGRKHGVGWAHALGCRQVDRIGANRAPCYDLALAEAGGCRATRRSIASVRYGQQTLRYGLHSYF
ncbi:unnamed protein product, partial [Amoebophrya sp. A25]